jgi:hypothetical protein
MIKPLYREVLLHDKVPTLTFSRRSVRIGSLEIPLDKRHQEQTLAAIKSLFGAASEIHVYLTSHLLYSGSRIITFSSKKPLTIIYKQIGTMQAFVD